MSVLLAAPLAVLGAPTAAVAAAGDGGFAARMLELVNQHRATAGVAPLQSSPALEGVAHDGRFDGCGFAVSGRAADMGARHYFSHTIASCGTKGVSDMLTAAGIATSRWGENIAWMSGTTDPLLAATRLTTNLMASPGHRANILHPDFTHVGLGSWRTPSGATWRGGGYAVTNVFVTAQVFGRLPTSPTPTVPGAPTAVTAVGGDGSLAASWAPAASGPAVAGYGVFAWDSGGLTSSHVVVCATCRTATLSGLANGRTYYVTVYGYNASGWGPPAFSSWVTVAAVPAAVTEVRVAPGNSSMTAAWRGPTDPAMAVDGYALFAFDAAGYTGTYAWVCATCATATVTGLVNGRSYLGVVFAHNANGWGTPTLTEWIVAGAPGLPGNLAVTRGNGSATATWSAAPASGSPVDLYGVFVFDAAGTPGSTPPRAPPAPRPRSPG